jgi:hypothetical protein
MGDRMSGELLEKLFVELSTICASETPRKLALRIALEDILRSFHDSRFQGRPEDHASFVERRANRALARVGINVETSET